MFGVRGLAHTSLSIYQLPGQVKPSFQELLGNFSGQETADVVRWRRQQQRDEVGIKGVASEYGERLGVKFARLVTHPTARMRPAW